jgi:alkyl sulfatase BDS1-like metallo-beta-lactamase superfamily hydrolase
MSADAPAQEKPPLASLVLQGDAQAEAIAITDFVFMAKDISNAYLITTSDGDVMVNTGFMDNAERTKRLLDPVRTGPLRRIILTQSHADHFGGVPTFKEPATEVIAQDQFLRNGRDMTGLQPFFGPRSFKLWGATLKRPTKPLPPPEITPDILFDRSYAFEQGGRRFELISTPDGETTDALTVWMPNEKIAFTGNLFGPVFEAMPNLVTIRGDKLRMVWSYLSSLEKVRDLGVELLITGHGEPIRGAATIRAALDRMHGAVTWLRDYTLDGMMAGKDVHTLMREVKLPEHLRIGEFHGKASWNVRTIWEEYAGWFHYDSTTSLYGVPRSSVNADLAELAGGADVLAARAQAKLDAGQPLEAIHLLDVALGAEPANRTALTVKKAALESLLAASGGSNLSETMWLKSEITAATQSLGAENGGAGS